MLIKRYNKITLIIFYPQDLHLHVAESLLSKINTHFNIVKEAFAMKVLQIIKQHVLTILSNLIVELEEISIELSNQLRTLKREKCNRISC
jgi:hypothetical protein